MPLRYYQKNAVDAFHGYMQDNEPGKNPCNVLPTGGGKTHVIAQICEDVMRLGSRVMVVAHVQELLGQAVDKLEGYGMNPGVYAAGLGRRDINSRLTVASVQSVYRRGFELCGTNPFGLILVDEAHRIPLSGDGMYQQLFKDLAVANPKLRGGGLTATPYRTGQGSVCTPNGFLNEICYEVGVRELIDGGFLCPLTGKRGQSDVDTSTLRKQSGEFRADEMEGAFNQCDKVNAAVSEILARTADRKKVLIFTCGVAHASEVANRIDKAGQTVRVVSSHHKGRSNAIAEFKAGKCKYLVNVNVLCEGFDATDIDAVVLLRATASPGLYYQMVGRGLRPDPSKKDCLVLDYGENIKRHGPVDNLQVNKAGKSSTGGGEAPMKACPQCDLLVYASSRVCQGCSFQFPETEVNHDREAADESPIGETPAETIDVSAVTYKLHQRKKRPGETVEPKPCMRVTYFDGVSPVADEWICIEHCGFAYEKAFQWWRKRSSNPMPKTVELAVELADAGCIAEARQITVKDRPGTQFREVLSTVCDDKPNVVELPEVAEEVEVIAPPASRYRPADIQRDLFTDSEVPF